MVTNPFLDFEGKKIIVTGASSGIGRAISIELSRHGVDLILMGRNQERLEEAASRLASGSHETISLDLTNHSEIVPKIRELAKQVGRIYGLCHCAGIVKTLPLSSCNVEGINAMMGVNFVSGLEVSRAICRHDVMEEDGGSILFISSIYGQVGKPGQIGYSASKGAVTAAARSMAVELARRKIKVNTLSPGLVRTPMIEESFSKLNSQQINDIEKSFPLGIGAPEDVARAAVFLLAPQNKWITGIDLVIDGGYTAQ